MLGSSTFRHGVHPPESKQLTENVRVRRMPFPDEVVLPLRQHAGKPAQLLVSVGDRVEHVGDEEAEEQRGEDVAEPVRPEDRRQEDGDQEGQPDAAFL